MKLDKKIVLVTGASKGIGAATAERLAAENMKVLINYNQDDSAAKDVLKAIERSGGDGELMKADIGNKQKVASMFQKIKEQFGKLDVLVNNVGIIDDQDSVRNAAVYRKIFEVNLFAQIEVVDKALDLMGKGKIVFVSSVHGGIGRGRPSAAAYSASKAAVDSYLKNLAKEVAPDVLVNGVAPGRVMTSMWGKMDEKAKADRAKAHLTDRWIEPSEIADGIAFLLKNDSMCGEVIVIDGGMSLKTLG